MKKSKVTDSPIIEALKRAEAGLAILGSHPFGAAARTATKGNCEKRKSKNNSNRIICSIPTITCSSV